MLPAYCAPRPPSPILPAQRALHSSHPALPPHTPIANSPTDPRPLPCVCSAQFCSVQKSGHDGYTRYASRRHTYPGTHPGVTLRHTAFARCMC